MGVVRSWPLCGSKALLTAAATLFGLVPDRQSWDVPSKRKSSEEKDNLFLVTLSVGQLQLKADVRSCSSPLAELSLV